MLKNQYGQYLMTVIEEVERTVRWYLDNQEWMDNITFGDYEHYYEGMYKKR